jgi:outer membrane protein assembly factor BamB
VLALALDREGVMRVILGSLVASVALATNVIAEDWPNWRGPSRDGRSGEVSVPTKWSTTEGVAWKLAMPAWSGSTPIIWGEYVFVSTADGGKRVASRRGRDGGGAAPAVDPAAETLSLWCIDRSTGRVLWKRGLGGGNNQQRKQNMSSPSPVTDGKHVWVLTGTGILKSFDFAGKEIWSRDIQADYGSFGLNWGYASSPTLHDGRLYVQVLHGMKTDDPSYVLALDVADGSTVWRVERPTDAVRESPDSYTTPAIVEADGKTTIVITGGDYVTGHDSATGEELWRAGGLNPGKNRNYRVVASALVRDGLLFVPTREDPLQAFRINGLEAPTLLWQTREGPDVPTPVSDGERLYIVKDNGVMFCMNAATGAVVWGPQRIRTGTYSASPVLVDGMIYATSEDGVTTIVAAKPEFEVIAENDLGGYTLASPAISDGQIFMRTESHLYCIGERRGS